MVLLGFRVKDKVKLKLELVLELVHFTLCHTCSPHPRKPAFYP